MSAATTDLAWAAGLFEGEGCFSFQPKAPRAMLSMSDEDVVRRFHQTVGIGSVHQTKRREGRKDLWTWTAAGFPSFQYIVALLWRWLGTRRRARARELLRQFAALPARRPERLVCKRGHDMANDTVIVRRRGSEVRQCRKCLTENTLAYRRRQKEC